MWSLVSSMKLLRKPSKRGEGDLDRNKSSKDSSQAAGSSSESKSGNGGGKVERRESARLSYGASKFLRSLRNSSGHSNNNKNSDHRDEPVNVIALKELDTEAISLDTRGQPENPNQKSRVPERSQSFQEKRLLVVTSKSCAEPNANGSPAKLKHSRTQSFVCNNSNSQNPSGNSAYNSFYSRQAPPQNQNIYSKLNPVTSSASQSSTNDNSNRSNSNSNCETIYENLEVILEHAEKIKNPVAQNQNSSNSKVISSSSNSNSSKVAQNSKGATNAMTIFEKDRERRSSARKLTKDSGYETNYSDYMNIDSLTGSSSLNVSSCTDPSANSKANANSNNKMKDYSALPYSTANVYGTTTTHKTSSTPPNHTKGDSNSINNSSSTSSSSRNRSSSETTNSRRRDRSRERQDGMLDSNKQQQHSFPSHPPSTQENRKLRRSISEVPSERLNLSKLQAKVMDNSRAIYSSISNGLSIWSVEKQNSGGSSKNQGVYGVCQEGLYVKSVGGSGTTLTSSTSVSTLPRTSSSSYHHQQQQPQQQTYQVSAKSTPSLRNALEVSADACGNSTSTSTASNIYQSILPLSPARSTPNLQPTSASSNKQQLNNLNRIYESPSALNHSKQKPQQQTSQQQQTPSNNSNNAASASASNNFNGGREKHYGLIRLPSLERSNENLYETCATPNTSTTSPPPTTNTCTSTSYSSNTATITTTNPIYTSCESTKPSNTMSNSSNSNSWSKQDCSSQSAPVRDSSSLKQTRYGPGHEKYPSWPIPVSSAAQIDPAGELNPAKMMANSGSSRSKSWTDSTDYPKEKVPTYARPYMKRMNQAFTQQLKTVMEKCERIPPETFDNKLGGSVGGGSRGAHNGFSTGILPPPVAYRDMMYSLNGNGNSNSSYAQFQHQAALLQHQMNQSEREHDGMDKEYNIPSPPERDIGDQAMKPLTQEDLELYAKKYEEMMSQYAHSEGYHSYISSECSSYISSGTPFLDQLRRESESNQSFWSGDSGDPTDPIFGANGGGYGMGLAQLAASGRESVTTVVTNSSSNSSGTETLKWHGSSSDLSTGSNSNNCNSANNNNNNNCSNNSNNNNSANHSNSSSNGRSWEQQQKSIAHSAKVPLPQKLLPESVHLHSSGMRHSKNKLESHSHLSSPTKNSSSSSSAQSSDFNNIMGSTTNSSSTPNLKKFPLSTYTRPNSLQLSQEKLCHSFVQEKIKQHQQKIQKSPSTPNHLDGAAVQTSPIIDTSKPPSVAERILELEQQAQSSCSSSSTSSPKIGTHHHNNSNANNHSATITSTSSSSNSTSIYQEKFVKSSSLNNLRDKQVQQHQSLTNSPGLVKKDLSLALNTADPSQKPFTESYQNFWNTFNESNSLRASTSASTLPTDNGQVSYTYLDPDKKHKVADMTLKAIQKKALLSYYERHTGKSASSSDSVSSGSGSSCRSQPQCSPNSHSRQSESVSSSASSSSGSGSSSNLLEKDSPFPSNRLTLSLPRDIDRIKGEQNNIIARFAENANESRKESGSGETLLPTTPNGNSKGNGCPPANSRTSSQSAMTNGRKIPTAPSATSPSTVDTQLSSGAETKGESRRKGYHLSSKTQSQDEDSSEESARMAYMSKYLPHLVNRETTGSQSAPTWSGVTTMKSGGAQQNSEPQFAGTEEPAPVPPERPPKKPHLRNLSQQVADDGNDSCPPPPLPRAPIRPPQSVPLSSANNNVTAPPVPSKSVMAVPRCPSPDLPPPPPPPVVEEEVEVLNDEPLPPPPTLNEVHNLVGARSRSVSGLSSYLHKDSYLAQRKERTLGYEGRYRRTLSPSGLTSKSTTAGESVVTPARSMSSATSTGKLDSTLSPSAWEKYHNIRPPSTTVIFTSHEIAKGPVASQPLFHRSISCDSNLFNNKTGFSQSSIPPPVAQVAPLRGVSELPSHCTSQSSLDKVESSSGFLPIPCSSSSSSSLSSHSAGEKESLSSSTCTSLTKLTTSSSLIVNKSDKGSCRETTVKTLSQESPARLVTTTLTTAGGVSKSESVPSVMVSPLRFESRSRQENKENIPAPNITDNSGGVSAKTEVCLRVNCTSDASSQTESSAQNSSGSGSSSSSGSEAEGDNQLQPQTQLTLSSLSMTLSSTSSSSSSGSSSSSEDGNRKGGASSLTSTSSAASSYTGRQKSQEELECEELSRDLAKQLPHGDKLQSLLVPLPEHKTTADYMEGLFHLELKLKTDQLEKQQSIPNFVHHVNDIGNGRSTESCTSSPEPDEAEVINQNLNIKTASVQVGSSGPSSPRGGSDLSLESGDTSAHKRCNGHAPLPADSAYFTTSECKAKFLTQYVKDMHNESISNNDSQELNKRKEVLVSRISRKLDILRTEQLEIREEIQSNEQLGYTVIERVKQTAKRNEFDKFKLHVEEIEKITSLLLGLSGRLARAENALMALSENPNPQEKKILESKRDKLEEQLNEAKILKENIDRRSVQVSGFLQKYLTVEEYADYHHFVKMKAKLIIDSRDIDDKIKLGEEQMLALQETLSLATSS